MLIPIHKFLKNKIKGIIHVGAHTAEELSYYVEHGCNRVLWIEANPERWKELEGKIKQYPNMKLGKFAASSQTGGTTYLKLSGISSSVLNMGTHKTKYPGSNPTHSVEVELVAVDDWISTNQEKRYNYNFLNIDVQGYELEALRGLQKQLLDIDAIYSEINYEYLYENGALVGDVDQFLAGHGFKRVATETVKGMGWGEALYIKGMTLQLTVYLKFLIYKLVSVKAALRSKLKQKALQNKDQ
tara:strand:+ start:818 stop:1543 length:726 start_codon:yes stop_codon:yes gene_type:complete